MDNNRQPITDKLAENITRTEELAYELRISEAMTKNVFCLSADMEMEDVLNIFQEKRILARL